MTTAVSILERLWDLFRSGQGRMTGADADRWWEAETVEDLAALTADWLEGGIASQPGYEANCGPDEETVHLIPVLAAANRAGYLTDASQPGVPPETGYDGATWVQRAAVSGFASADLAYRIRDVCTAAGMLVHLHPPAPGLRGHGRFREYDGATVTSRDGQSVTWFGARRRPSDIRFSYDECGECCPDAVKALIAAHQVTVIDPEWGRDDVLWPLLSTIAGNRVYAEGEHTPQETHMNDNRSSAGDAS